MANVTTSDRLWKLDTAADIKAAGVPMKVRRLIFFPAVIDDDVNIQEYNAAGTAADAITLKANHTDVNPITVDFGPKCRQLNGFKLATIDGGRVDVYLGER